MDAINNALEARLVGVKSNTCGNSVLDDVLALHYKITYNVLAGSHQETIWAVILEETLSLNLQENCELCQSIIFNMLGIVHFYLGNKKDSNKWLAMLGDAKGVEEKYPAFWNLLQLENFYYRVKLDFGINKKLLCCLKSIPKESHTLIWYYLENTLNLKCNNWEQIFESYGESPLAYLFGVLAAPDSVDEMQLLQYGKQILSHSKFPSAREKNNPDLEDYHIVLQLYFRNCLHVPSEEWRDLLNESMVTTFQSISISKAAIFYFTRIGEERIGLLNFLNFIKYSERHRIITGFYDIISVIDAYNYVLGQEHIPEEIGQDFSRFRSLNKLKQLIDEFYGEYNFKLVSKVESTDWFSNYVRILVPHNLSKTLSNAWYLFYCYEKSSLTHLLNNDLTYYLINAMIVDHNSNDFKFQYAYVLALMREIEKCSAFLKGEVLNHSSDDYRSWHLLALCECILENKEVSFKIVCSVLEAMRKAEMEGRLSIGDRWQYVNLKLTQITLVEEILGFEDALDMLSEVYELYATLFPPGTKNSNQYRLGPKHKHTKEYLFQSIWFFAARLFLKNGDIINSQEAIDEANRVTEAFTNLNANIIRGYIKLSTDSQAAMTEFQTVLSFDPVNVDALIGFAKLVYPDEEDKTHTFDEETPIISKTCQNNIAISNAFANERDKSAAVAQLKLMLEGCIENSIEGYHTPELWWYASRIYDEYNDLETLENALWQCIKFQELKPIRDFQYCIF